MAKEEVEESEEKDETQEGQAAEGAEAEKKGFIKKLLGNRKLLLIGGGGLIALLLAIGGGLYFFLFSGSEEQKPIVAANTESLPPLPATPPQVVFYNMPDLVVNIQTTDSTQAYLKLSVALELDSPAEKPGIQAYMPRVVDQFQDYLRELRLDDLKGSAGISRLKEELLRRINAVIAPYRVRDVLLKEMIVQ